MALIVSENPKTISKTYNNWWLARIEGNTTNPNQPNQSFSMNFVFIRGNKLEDGTWELSPFQEDVKAFAIEDVFAFAANEAQNNNTEPAQLLEGIVGFAASIAKTNNVID